MAADISSVVTTILANGSTNFSRIPALTRDNFQDVGNAILNYTPAANEFLTSLLNKIVMQLVQNKTFNNPLAVLKKGEKPIGFDIENSYVNPATAAIYDPTGANLLTTAKPDVKTEYFRLNRQDRYKVTIWPDQLKHAFTSFEAMGSFIDAITGSLANGDYIDEFILMKQLFADAVLEQKMIRASVTAVTDEATAKAFLVSLKNLSSAFQYPSTAFNAYAKAGGTGTAVTTWCPKEQQILVLRSDLLNYVDSMVLAAAFNLDKAELKNRIVEVDNFGIGSNILGVICDEAAIHVWDDKATMAGPWENPEGLYMQYYFHHWQTYAFSLMANAVAIVDDATADNAPVLTENTLTATDTTPAGTGVAGSLLTFQVWNAAETVLVEQKQVIVAANNAWTVTLDDGLVEGQKIVAWQVDMGGNKSATDTFTVAA